MHVLKFGGTSVGSAKQMQQVLSIIRKKPFPKCVVLSAMAGTTNTLVSFLDKVAIGDLAEASNLIRSLKKEYLGTVNELLQNKNTREAGIRIIENSFNKLNRFLDKSDSPESNGSILAQGELISTQLFHLLCQEAGVESKLLPALEFMKTDENGEPDMHAIKLAWAATMEKIGDSPIYITQGYICRNHQGEIDNLQRGGSDYTATILGAVSLAKEIEIWTDIDGVHNNDPRIVEDTFPVRRLSFREAAELAYFGAKILHPTCVIPAEQAGVSVRLKNTLNPDAPGTLISNKTSNRAIAAVAAKDKISVIKVYSHRMLLAYGFLRKVFQVFEDHETPIDMITTSEVAVSLTIDKTDHVESILQDLQQFGEVEYEENHTIICIVGNGLYDRIGYVDEVFRAMKNVPIRMVSMGGSRYNISLLIKSQYKESSLQALNESLFSRNLSMM